VTGDPPGGRPGKGDSLIEVPAAFRAMPRWWTQGPAWLDNLPVAVRDRCLRWRLRLDGRPAHGSNALVVPVVRDGEPLVLRMTPPGPEVAGQVRALRFWAGRGTVLLHDADEAGGAMLLERLDGTRQVTGLPVADAMVVLGQVMRRLAVPADPAAPSTAVAVAADAVELEREPERARIDRVFVDAALGAAGSLSTAATDLAVNGDLHSDQVLRGNREPWLAVDPVLMRGDIEYDLARVLWTRVDEMADNEIMTHFDAVVGAAGLDRDRARDWVVFRAASYWRWGLDHGLTEDPPRCRRLLAALTG